MNNKINNLNTLNEWFSIFSLVGRNNEGGVTRIAYSSEEDKMHEILKDISEKLGFHVEIDGIGNTFISLRGNDSRVPYLIGSHLDSVPNGGKYDGFTGVLGGLLILKWIKENGIDIPVKVVAFRCEESSAFGKATVGSGLATGKIKEEELSAFRNSHGEKLYDILKSRGFLTKAYKLGVLKGYLEIHIEQGRVLYDNNIKVGVVTSIAGCTRYKLSIYGRQDHSGATPMSMRKDALSAASEIILEIERLGKQESVHSTVATVGEIHETPNSLNVVPGFVELGIDIRGINHDSIKRVIDKLVVKTEKIAHKRGLSYKFITTSSTEPVKLDNEIVEGLEMCTKEFGIDYIKLPSGAGHDAMEMSSITKAGMLFIPCKEGISHNPNEKADLEDLQEACKIIFNYLKEVFK